MTKLVCNDCGWKGTEDQLLTGRNPFATSELIYGCPQCKGIECYRSACEEIDCWEEDTCGTPTETGYKRTCHNHTPNAALRVGEAIPSGGVVGKEIRK